MGYPDRADDRRASLFLRRGALCTYSRVSYRASCVHNVGFRTAVCVVLGLFSIQEKALFYTRYHLHITLLSLCIIVYHCRYHNISCPSATHDILVYHLFFFCF
jgi:hypothetical protein